MNRLLVVVALAGGCGLGAGLAGLAGDHTAAGLERLSVPRPVTLAGLSSGLRAGDWTLVMFGFARCPDACPTGLAQLSALQRLMPGRWNVLFVSVDPLRDSPAQVQTFAARFGDRFMGATGNLSVLKAVAGSFGARFEHNGGEIAHSTTFHVVDPQGRMRARFRPGFDVQRIVVELRGLGLGAGLAQTGPP